MITDENMDLHKEIKSNLNVSICLYPHVLISVQDRWMFKTKHSNALWDIIICIKVKCMILIAQKGGKKMEVFCYIRNDIIARPSMINWMHIITSRPTTKKINKAKDLTNKAPVDIKWKNRKSLLIQKTSENNEIRTKHMRQIENK